jgi:hypothetical protein
MKAEEFFIKLPVSVKVETIKEDLLKKKEIEKEIYTLMFSDLEVDKPLKMIEEFLKGYKREVKKFEETIEEGRKILEGYLLVKYLSFLATEKITKPDVELSVLENIALKKFKYWLETSNINKIISNIEV